MWLFHLVFLLFIVCWIFLSPWFYITLLPFSYDRSIWSSPSFSSNIFQNSPDMYNLQDSDLQFFLENIHRIKFDILKNIGSGWIIQGVRKVAVDCTLPDFYLWGAAKSTVYRDRSRTFNELKTAITAYLRNISQADLQKVFASKIKRVQACIDARGHHFQHLL